MSVVFYCLDADTTPIEPVVRHDVEITYWQPSRDGRPTGMFATRVNQVWWLLSSLGAFARRDFTAVVVRRDGQLLHRLLVSPKWYRFPDMSARDLQMGMLWTAAEARGQGYARAAIAAVHARFAGSYDRMWYLVEADNGPSRRLIESFGYREVAHGERTAPFGLGAIGRFVITSPREAEPPAEPGST